MYHLFIMRHASPLGGEREREGGINRGKEEEVERDRERER
jgi:hypothetical protein